jgi:hypothetical protein
MALADRREPGMTRILGGIGIEEGRHLVVSEVPVEGEFWHDSSGLPRFDSFCPEDWSSSSGEEGPKIPDQPKIPFRQGYLYIFGMV